MAAVCDGHVVLNANADPLPAVIDLRLALTLILSYPHPRPTGIAGLLKLVIFLFWILLQVA